MSEDSSDPVELLRQSSDTQALGRCGTATRAAAPAGAPCAWTPAQGRIDPSDCCRTFGRLSGAVNDYVRQPEHAVLLWLRFLTGRAATFAPPPPRRPDARRGREVSLGTRGDAAGDSISLAAQLLAGSRR